MEAYRYVFALRLRELRERHNLSRKTLGELCGLSKNAIGRYERMERAPDGTAITRIADFFEVPTDYLLRMQK